MTNDPKKPQGAGDAQFMVKCPGCGKEAPYENNPWRPFCSSRCQIEDRANWARGNYSIPSEDSPGSDNGDEG